MSELVARFSRPSSLPAATDRFVVVEASAGTGKTYFLEHRVVDLILGADAELGQILLVTFTEKAVAELRLRIRDLIDRVSRASEAEVAGSCWTIDDAARRRLRAAVTAFDRAPIFTIHGFCHRILVEDAFAAQRLFEQTQVADEVAFDAAFYSLVRERFATHEPERELLLAYLSANRTLEKLRDLLLDCARAGRDARVRRLLEPEPVRAAIGRLVAVMGTERQQQTINASLPRNGNQRRYIEPWVHEIGKAIVTAGAETTAPQLLALLDRVREPLAKLLPYAAGSPAHAELTAALRGVATTLSLDEAIAAELLPQVLDRVGRDKAEHGLYDYDDMLELVWRALVGPRGPELAARLRARTPWAMIDEFQDTDPVQWNIFRTVFLHPAARGLTIVGDPKQAIYGFRGADVHTYLAARDEMLRANATRVALDINRRSTEPLVAAVNAVLIGNFGMPLLDGAITYDDIVTASGDIETPDLRPPVCVFALRSEAGKSNVDPNRAALAGAIGDAIEALQRAPMQWTSRGVAQPFSLSQIMVLTRANRDSTEIAAVLRSRGLACALVEPEKLFETREAIELAAVLGAIAAPRDRSARLRALHTRFFDVPWGDLMHVVDAPDHHPAIARIFDWSQLAARRAYETLFRRIVEDSRYAERALVLGGGERALTNTWHLIELLVAEVARSRSDLSEVVVQLRRWIADGSLQHEAASTGDERDIQRAETDADAIRVLTIHKAKGLEAPYVFVYGGTGAAPRSNVHTLRDAAGRAIFVGHHDPDTKQRIENETASENQRLAYVGLTRAQVRLYLPIYEYQLAATSAYFPIQRCLLPQAQRSTGRKLFETVVVPVGAPEAQPAPLEALAGFVAEPPPPDTKVAQLPATQRGLAMLSYTRLARDLEAATRVGGAWTPVDQRRTAAEIDPSEFDTDHATTPRSRAEQPPIEVGPGELPPGADAGLMLHDVLEVADLAHARATRTDVAAWRADPTVEAQLVDAARARGIAPACLDHAARLCHATLVAPMVLVGGGELPAMIDATQLARETEFSFPLPSGRGLVRGFIDALVAYDDELWVLDYKSDYLVGEDLAAAAKERVDEHYLIQARLYALAADRMRGSRRLAGLLYAFIRHGIVVAIRVDDLALAGYFAWLDRIGQVTA